LESSPSLFQKEKYIKKNIDPLLLQINEILHLSENTSSSSIVGTGIETLTKEVDTLQSQAEFLQVEIEELERQKAKNVHQLEADVSTLNNLLYSSQTAAQPEMTPKALSEVHHQLENGLQKLGNEMDTLIKDRSAKLEKLENSEEERIKRNMFIHFFTNPEYLEQTVNHLQNRLEARKIQ